MSSLSTDIGGRTALVSGSTQEIGRAIAAAEGPAAPFAALPDVDNIVL
ncbi:MAG TPA: hypothetical protein VNT55_05535 [Baekduia sp.]|nr:hypothetical protein [Baekduia sp.]